MNATVALYHEVLRCVTAKLPESGALLALLGQGTTL